MALFNPLWVSIKFPVCSVPLNLDSYKHCEYDCVYCYSKNRGMIDTSRINDKPNMIWIKNKFEKVYDKKEINPTNFIEVMLKNKITMKGGVASDCFQKREEKDKQTKQLVELCNDYKQTILFNTKTSDLYDVPVTPKLHSFQLSVSNVYDIKEIEPNVSSIDERVKFYDELKDEGFKVNIRIQPLIPNVSDFKIFDKFKDADHVSMCVLYLQQRDPISVKKVVDSCNLNKNDFKTSGIAKMHTHLRQQIYKEFGDYLDEIGVSWNVSDTNMHQGTDRCCCGDSVVPNPLPFSSMQLIQDKGRDYTMEDVLEYCGEYKDCRCDSLFTSNRREGCITIEDFYKKRWDRQISPFSAKYNIDPATLDMSKQLSLDKWSC